MSDPPLLQAEAVLPTTPDSQRENKILMNRPLPVKYFIAPPPRPSVLAASPILCTRMTALPPVHPTPIIKFVDEDYFSLVILIQSSRYKIHKRP